ncbi:MAG: DUF4118 domain-containing protein [Sulfuricella sp.]|nr:DUF4118 domain-containing protein [Sulfuricella sp.]
MSNGSSAPPGWPGTSPLGQHGNAWAIAACLLTALLATPLRPYLELSNIVMLFLLAVLLVAVRFGRTPAVLAAFLSVALFDFLFVPPRFSFSVHDAQYLVTFAVMLAVALITGQLAAGLRLQAEQASRKEQQTRALYEMARDLAGALTAQQVSETLRRFLRENFDLDAVLLLPELENHLVPASAPENGFQIEPNLALTVYRQGQPIEDYNFSGYGYGAIYFPLKAPMRVRGVILAALGTPNPDALAEHKPLLMTLSSLVAIAVERLHYVEVAQATQVEMLSERLRSSILSALSHDLRTPLTALVGLADSLALTQPPLPATARESAEALREQALRLNGLVANLLDMARLHAGHVKLRKEWQPVEEVVGASIQLLSRSLADHPVRVRLAPDLPLLDFDAVLIERVFCNLLENAAKYAPPHSGIEIVGSLAGPFAEITVCDAGPGFPEDKRRVLFEMFVRGAVESATPGVGLGLAICRAIVEAHGGAIRAANRPEGGACVTFTLPLGTPPGIEIEALEAETDHE